MPMRLHFTGRFFIAAAGVVTLVAISACSADFGSYITEERSGSVSLLLINNTDARAVFSVGSYDSLDRNPPGPIQLQQLRIEAHTSNNSVSLTCRRDVSIGTAELVKRVVDTRTDENTANFDADALDETVHFSLLATNAPGSSLPDAGEAAGMHKRLGVDFTCGDTLIFTFEKDADAVGGFRVDFQVIQDREADANGAPQ